ncbi:MAG: zf-HC2 domain-containing protein, partial [Gemmatimonadota bacterium]|nr:zf-HC2 domain-containing protein [Gemmatimonadota bacterium]
MTNSNITCEAFDAALPDYLEETLDGATRASVDRHLRECVRCTGLVRDLENISKEAAALPDLVPSRDLWAGIEARIAAPVIPLAARPERQRLFVPAWMGIAAAALIVSTAGVTFLLTARSLRTGSDVGGVSANPAVLPIQSAQEAPAAAEPGTATAQNQSPPPGLSRMAGGLAAPSRAGVPATLASRDVQPGSVQSEAVYGKEIEMLQNIVRQRKTQLDSSTVAIIEKNLQIIDAAIEQSKAALMKDPASMLLS